MKRKSKFAKKLTCREKNELKTLKLDQIISESSDDEMVHAHPNKTPYFNKETAPKRHSAQSYSYKLGSMTPSSLLKKIPHDA